MIVVFRIVKSEDKGESVVLILARDGVEDPKANAVVLNDDDLPSGIKKGYCTFKGKKRPKVMVNGVEMFLKAFSYQPIHTVTPEDFASGLVSWAMLQGLNPLSVATIAKQYAVHLDYRLMMEVAWE